MTLKQLEAFYRAASLGSFAAAAARLRHAVVAARTAETLKLVVKEGAIVKRQRTIKKELQFVYTKGRCHIFAGGNAADR